MTDDEDDEDEDEKLSSSRSLGNEVWKLSYLIGISKVRYQNGIKLVSNSHHMTNILLLKDTSGGKLMRGGGGEKQGTSAEKIMAGVHRAGHCFEMDSETPGDGNCFPRAVRQQCQRRAVGINSITDHKDLRKKVTQYMLKSEDRAVVNMRRRWEELEVRWSWQSYWRRMARDTEWVEEPFIWATAWFLERDIWIIWDTATPENLLTFFSGDREENGTACPGVPLIIGRP